MKSPPSAAVEDRPQKGNFSEIWAFLNRDVRTLKWWTKNKAAPETDVLAPLEFQKLKEPEPEIVSKVDPRQIEGLQLRREVLDWRDEFHFQVTETASQARKTLAEQVEHELAEMNFWRLRLFTKPVSEVLENQINSCVRSPMRKTTQIQQAALRKHLLTWLPQCQESISISVMWPKLEWDTHLALKFTADNREPILKILSELILGEGGLADRHRRWATQYADQILGKRYVQPDSI
jgi:hypothetical protein